MNKLVSEHTIDLLDRKYKFVLNSPAETFLFDLEQFVLFLTQDELISPFTAKIEQTHDEKFNKYQEQIKQEIEEAQKIKGTFIGLYPELDDSNEELADYPDTGDTLSFAYFNWKLHNEKDFSKLSPILIGILGYKISNVHNRSKKRKLQALNVKCYQLLRYHEYEVRAWQNHEMISSGKALYDLKESVKNINPHPNSPDLLDEIFAKDSSEYKALNSSDSDRKEKLEKEKDRLIPKLKRVYEAVRQEIGTTRLHLQLLSRYKIRCQWYNRNKLRSLILDEKENIVREREDNLTQDLALYIYDHGVTAAYRMRHGNHEFDLLELDANYPMFVEAKAYKDGTAKEKLISGVSQLHSYLCSYEAYKNVCEAYYVIFRIGGPIYEFPLSITTNRFTIYPIVIDIGVSGSKSKKAIVIQEKEIIEKIDAT